MKWRPLMLLAPVLAVAALVLWILSSKTVPSRPDGVQTLTQASITIRQIVPQARTHTEADTLPLHWDVSYRRTAGWATATLHFETTAEQRAQPQALLVPRLGNAYRITLNGEELASGGAIKIPNDGWTGRRPVWVRIPSAVLHEHNTLVITIRADFLRRAGISPVQWGPESALQDVWHSLEWQRVTIPRAVSLFCLVVAAFCALLWWQQHQAIYAAAALYQLAWSGRITALWLEQAPVDWPLWGRVVLGFFWLGGLTAYWLTHTVWGQRPRPERMMVAVMFLLCPITVGWGADNGLLAWTITFVAAWALFIGHLAQSCWQQADKPRVWILGMHTVCWAAFVTDVVAARMAESQYVHGGWTMLAALLSGAAILAIVGKRFQLARGQLLELTHSLEQRVALREAELAQQHEALRQMDRIRVKAEERSRILRDMHDGAGAHLITAMRQLEGGTASQAQVMQTLRESLDQLRLSVDAMSIPVGDINALLASLRYRLAQRIQDSGLSLDWDVELLPTWPAATEEGMRHLQYIVFEAISNVLQHAQASTLVVSAHTQTESITIELTDNGIGRHHDQSGNGLRTMQERAGLIHAQVQLNHTNDSLERPGTKVSIRLPLADALRP